MAISSCALCLVKRFVSQTLQHLQVVTIVGKKGYAEAARYVAHTFRQAESSCQRSQNIHRDAAHTAWIFDIREHDHELVTAQARDCIACAQAVGDSVGRLNQQKIACNMAEGVVKFFEMIQVQIQDGHRFAIALGASSGLLEAVRQQLAIWQSREQVVVGPSPLMPAIVARRTRKQGESRREREDEL